MKRQSRKRVVLFLEKAIQRGHSVGVKITFKLTRKFGRPTWSRFVEGEPRKLTSRIIVIDEGSIQKEEIRIPLNEIMEAYFVSP